MEFSSPGKFAAHLLKLAQITPLVTHHITKTLVQDIAENAKERIGHYQEAEGGFPKWPDLKESTEREKERLGYHLGEPLLRRGDLRDSISSEAVGNIGNAGSDSDIAVYHEYGTTKMAARPFMGPAAFTSVERGEIAAGSILKAWISGQKWKNKKLPKP